MLEEIDIANPKTKNEYLDYYKRIRARTEKLAEPLEKEDYVIQAVTDASPAKWHLAHVSWFYETFILKGFDAGYKPLNEMYNFIFNSYYNDVGEFFPRPMRGTLSRPTVSEVYDFRKYIDDSMLNVLDGITDNSILQTFTILGGNHEQQHQELMMTDIKHNFGSNPLFPVYKPTPTLDEKDSEPVSKMTFIPFEGGISEIGNKSEGFAFDNEMPVNKVYLNDYKLANRLVTNGEFIKMIEAGVYQDFKYWLSDGWDIVKRDEWKAPLHWHKINDEWHTFTLAGLKKINLNEPVTHVSYFEADAYAKFVNKRLPRETEWENAALKSNLTPAEGNFYETGYLHPKVVDLEKANEGDKLLQMYGDVWEWTGSAYLPYPGFSVLAEGVSEYNGKFMNAQWVLKGGSCVTPIDHIRTSYRNFFQSDKQWQFTGIRLAE
ncbi:MAG: ergothioneine biosynthesis protein EgtB [Candidatus Heimdallarchaeota archaeon]|nr:ergothioneine biosynthesis protein EgtB [Candidatus Heimdallarchaeota archaeon]